VELGDERQCVRIAKQIPGPAARPTAARSRELHTALAAPFASASNRREGPGGLTVRAVAAEAGIAPMGVYNHLGGKDGLIEALLTRGFDRLRAAVEPGDEPDMLDRLRNAQLRYREFALANPHLYALMFENAVPHERSSPAFSEHAAAAFTALVHNVELAAATGAITAPEPRAAAQQIWSAVHGAVTLELKRLVQVPDPEAAFRALISTLLRGMAQTRAS
jgi:AcrR family transcriptional regulator